MHDKLMITKNDRKILEVLWENGKMDMPSIVYTLGSDKWNRHTVRSCLLRLIDKQIVGVHKLSTRNHYYYTLINRDAFIAAETSAYVHDRYDGMANMIAGLAVGKQISDDELNEIEKFIQEFKKGNS